MIRACSFHKIAEKLIFSITQSIIFPFHYDIVYFLSFPPPQVVARIYVSTRDVPYKRVQFACIVSGKTVFAADVS